jgi:hypothetical protein
MAIEEITQLQTPEEAAYADISARMTAAYVACKDAEKAYADYWFSHPVPTAEVCAQGDKLRAEMERTARVFQDMFPEFNRARARVEGW